MVLERGAEYLGSHFYNTAQVGGALSNLKKQDNLVVVANRLPVNRVRRGAAAEWETSPGGLVSALRAVLLKQGVTWVGWTGIEGRSPKPFQHDGILHHPVPLSNAEVEGYYRNFSNRTLWPLYHDAVRPPEYHRHWWRPYVEVNRRFADAVARVLPRGGTAWVHDYHLQLVPEMLRKLRPDAEISFFLHIPFPPIELFAQIPWRHEILKGLLGADLVGFQTRLGAQNFARLARRFAGAQGTDQQLTSDNHDCFVQNIPISIDTERFQELARTPEVQDHAEELQHRFGADRRILLGVDRLDYTKGIDIRLRAFESLLQSQPKMAEKTVFIQVVVPSRKWVPEYQEIRMRIEQLVGQINGSFGEPGRVPVHYMFRNLLPKELVSYYIAADVMVVTPLRDGMNLVAKEYVACRLNNTGVLILSEFTGAARELKQSLQVNPHDIDGLASTFQHALTLAPAECSRRMSSLRRVIMNNDVFQWADRCLTIPKK
ncbi:MAG: trehalose-6-phosphate synthase [Planctomycetota bacterium]